MTNTWPPPGSHPATPQSFAGGPVPPQGPIHSPKRGGRTAAIAAGLVAIIAATAGITYALTRPNSADSSTQASSAAITQGSGEDSEAAKKKVCDTLDVITRGLPGKGGVRLPDGQVNVPVVLRAVTGVMALDDVLGPGVPAEVSRTATDYKHQVLALLAAGTGAAGSGEVDKLTDKTNTALNSFFDACGIPH